MSSWFCFTRSSCFLPGYGILKIITYVAVVSNVIDYRFRKASRDHFVYCFAGIRHCVHFRLHPAHGLQVCLLRHARLEGLHLSQPVNLQCKPTLLTPSEFPFNFQFSASRLQITKKSGVRRTKTIRILVSTEGIACRTTRPSLTTSRRSTGTFLLQD